MARDTPLEMRLTVNKVHKQPLSACLVLSPCSVRWRPARSVNQGLTRTYNGAVLAPSVNQGLTRTYNGAVLAEKDQIACFHRRLSAVNYRRVLQTKLLLAHYRRYSLTVRVTTRSRCIARKNMGSCRVDTVSFKWFRCRGEGMRTGAISEANTEKQRTS